MAWRMASPHGFSSESAGQSFKDHVYAVAVSNKHDRWANNKGPVLELGMPSVLHTASSNQANVRVAFFLFIKRGSFGPRAGGGEQAKPA